MITFMDCEEGIVIGASGGGGSQYLSLCGKFHFVRSVSFHSRRDSNDCQGCKPNRLKGQVLNESRIGAVNSKSEESDPDVSYR